MGTHKHTPRSQSHAPCRDQHFLDKQNGVWLPRYSSPVAMSTGRNARWADADSGLSLSVTQFLLQQPGCSRLPGEGLPFIIKVTEPLQLPKKTPPAFQLWAARGYLKYQQNKEGCWEGGIWITPRRNWIEFSNQALFTAVPTNNYFLDTPSDTYSYLYIQHTEPIWTIEKQVGSLLSMRITDFAVVSPHKAPVKITWHRLIQRIEKKTKQNSGTILF